jgi:hypothetical protein
MSFDPTRPSTRYRVHQHCRVCSTLLPQAFFNLGMQPLANNLYSTAEESLNAPRYPLALTRCPNSTCGLVQLTAVVDPDLLFGEYLYTPSQSKTFVRHFHDMGFALTERLGLGYDDLVVDIGSNDGLLLSFFRDNGSHVLGIEPASNLALQANQNGVPTLNAFFTGETAKSISRSPLYGKARLITATNVFAHMNEWHDFCRGITELLADDGVLVIEAPGLLEMVEQGTFDLIYHEHANYLALQPLRNLFAQHDLYLFDVEENTIHGGSLRLFVQHAAAHKQWGNGDDRVVERLKKEHEGITDATLAALDDRAQDVAEDLHAAIPIYAAIKSPAFFIGYGAPAKATVLINYCELTSSEIPMVADDSPLKQGKFIPGTNIAIVAPDVAFPHNDGGAGLPTAVIFPWNVADDILPKLRGRASAAIIPMPDVKVVNLAEEADEAE